VFIGRCTEPLEIDPERDPGVALDRPQALQAELAGGAEKFTPWFKLEWARIWRDHRAALLALQQEL